LPPTNDTDESVFICCRCFLDKYHSPAIEDRNRIAKNYNSLVEKHNNLVSKYKELLELHNNLKSKNLSSNKVFVSEKKITFGRHVSPSLKVKILKRDNYRCVWCGASVNDEGVKLHVDHIIPVNSPEGRDMTINQLNSPDNLRTLCNKCNIGKSNKLDEQLVI